MDIDPWPPYAITTLILLVAVLFTVSFFLLVSPPGMRPTRPLAAGRLLYFRLLQDRLFVVFALVMAVAQAVQVNILNPITREWVLSSTGIDFAGLLYSIEGDLVPSLSAIHWWPLLFVMFWFYLVFHNTFVFVAPLFLIYTGERRIARRLLVSYPVIWLLALPGFTFFPATNPSVYLGLESTLDRVIPGATEVFYRGTTIDNTIPSLHVGLATLIMLHGLHSSNPRYRWAVIVYAPAVAFSIVYMQVHWAMDILAGVLVAVAAYYAGLALERRIHPAPEEYAPVPQGNEGRSAKTRERPGPPETPQPALKRR